MILEVTDEILEALDCTLPWVREALSTLRAAGRPIVWSTGRAPDRLVRIGLGDVAIVGVPDDLVVALDRHEVRDLVISPRHPDIRYRHVVKRDDHYYLLANEGLTPVTLTAEIQVAGALSVIDPLAGTETPVSALADLALPPYTTLVARVAPSVSSMVK